MKEMGWKLMIDRLALLFTLAPVTRGFFAMMISGLSFPLCGVMLLRLDLIPMRYMLMHGVILGGAISLALSLPVLPVSLVINCLLIFMMIFLTRKQSFGFSGASAGAMVFSMALASIIMHVKDVPAKDTLSLMWGSPFALTITDIIILALLALLLFLYIIFNFRNILSIFFNLEIAQSLGVKVHFHRSFMVFVIALVVALAMKLLGAFLVDSLLILPVLTASFLAGKKFKGIKKLFLVSSIAGLLISVSGYLLAIAINWPPSASISLVSGFVFLLSSLKNKISFGRKIK